MKTIKKLTKANIKKYEGFKVREDLNFSDDGSYFRGFEYKGMPLTQCVYQGIAYLCIRPDYLKSDYSWEDLRNSEAYNLIDKYNGTGIEFTMEELIKDIEKVIEIVNELNAKANQENYEEVIERIKENVEKEKEDIQNCLKTITNIFWLSYTDYELDSLKDCAKALANYLKDANDILNGTKEISVQELRRIKSNLNKNPEYKILNSDFRIERAFNIISKHI